MPICSRKDREVDEEQVKQGIDGEIEKTYLKKGRKMHRVILREAVSNALEPTVEDGYICLIRKNNEPF